MPTDKDIAISVQGLSKSYTLSHQSSRYATAREALMHRVLHPFEKPERETFWALKDVSFDIPKGEVVGIIGRNGAGKSTLLKILSRITEPTQGRAILHGRVGSLLEVGTGFHPELTGRENIYLNGAVLGMARREIDKQFDAIVDFAEVEQFLDTPVKRYSSGMYVRLAFAVAAHLNPEILVVDEVLAVGDAAFQKKCIGKMEDVAKHEGRTILFVSHNLEAVRTLCTSGVLLEKGKIASAGDVVSVIRYYMDCGAASQSVYNIEPKTEHDAPAYAFRISVENGRGEPVAEIPVGQPWQVRVSFNVTRKTSEFVIGLGVLTPMDSPLRTSWSRPQTVDIGEYEAVFRDDKIILEPGRYPFVVGLSHHGHTFQFIDKIGVLQIAEIADFTEDIHLVRMRDCGFILNPLDVVVRRCS